MRSRGPAHATPRGTAVAALPSTGRTGAAPAIPGACDDGPSFSVPAPRPRSDRAWGAMTENHRVQFAWDLRDALRARLRGSPAEPSSEARNFLIRITDAVEGGIIAPDRFHRALVAFVMGITGTDFSLDPEEMAGRVLACSRSRLETAFSSLLRPENVIARRTASCREGAAKLGRAVIGEILRARPDPDGKSNLSLLMGRLPFIPAFAWGHLGETVGIGDPRSFLAELERTSPRDLDDITQFLAGDAAAWIVMTEALAATRRSPLTTWSRASMLDRLASLSIQPEASTRLQDQANAFADAIAAPGIDEDTVRALLRARQRTSAHLLSSLWSEVERAFGANVAGRLSSGIDVDEEVARLADARDGIKVYTDLESPYAIRLKAERLLQRVAGAGLRMLGDELRLRIFERPGLSALRTLIRSRPEKALHSRVILSELIQMHTDISDVDGESHGRRLLRIAARLSSPQGVEALLDRLEGALSRDETGFIDELREHWTSRERMEAAARAERVRLSSLEVELDRGRLVLERSLALEVERHMSASFPDEGAGYLATDGVELRFLPIRNILAGSALGPSMALFDERELAHLHWLIEKIGLSLVAKVHSHPHASPVFSDADMESTRRLQALEPSFRTVIVGMDGSSRSGGGVRAFRWGSFVGGVDGQVRSEDTVEIR